MTLQIIGGGEMGQAIAWGLTSAGYSDEFFIVEISKSRIEFMSSEFPNISVMQSPEDNIDTLLAVKPKDVLNVCEALNKPKRLLSIAAGVTTQAIESRFSDPIPVIRAMPNTPALINSAVSGVCMGSNSTNEDLDWAKEILNVIGEVVPVEESKMDLVTGLSGSGPAYVYSLVNSFCQAGVQLGLNQEQSLTFASQVFLGAAKLLDSSDATLEQLIESVSTPNGTTVAGLAVLEEAALDETFAAVISVAMVRSAQIGEEYQ